MSDDSIREGDWCRVHYNRDCPGGGKPHHPAEEGARVRVSVAYTDGRDHPIVGLYQGRPWETMLPPPGGLGIGRAFESDELEVIVTNCTKCRTSAATRGDRQARRAPVDAAPRFFRLIRSCANRMDSVRK
jgi:hypothetical protein